MALSLTGIAIPMLAMYIITGGSALLTLIIGAPSFIDAAKKLFKAKTLTMDALYSVTALTAIGVSIASFFFPMLPMMCSAGLLMMGFRRLGQAIEDSLKQKTKVKLDFFSRLAPHYECENDKDHRSILAFEFIEPEHIIKVKKGDVIPVDGICLDDHASIIKSIDDGNLNAQDIAKDAKVYAGMRVANENIRILASQNVNNSLLGKLNSELEQTRHEKAPIVTASQQALKWFLPTVIGIALVASVIIGLCFPPALAIPSAISCGLWILGAACPCTLGMITPMAIKIGTQKAQDKGIIFASGKHLQAAGNIDTVVFDLNGTLTVGKPSVTSSTFIDKIYDKKKLFNYIAALESSSSHPFAHAIKTFANRKKQTTLNSKDVFADIEHTKYSGIRAKITDKDSTFDGKMLSIGNSQMMRDLEITIPETLNKTETAKHRIFIALDTQVLGYILLEDPLRSDAIPTIRELKKMGKEIHLCTGADEHTAKKYAEELGIPLERVKFGFKNTAASEPANDAEIKTKVQYIASLQAVGKQVAMVGDAENDATAIKKADLGIAMKSCDNLTGHFAGANILSDSLKPIVAGFEVAKQTVSNIKQNLIFSLTYNIIAVVAPIAIACVLCCVLAPPLALAVLAIALSPAIGAGLMILQSSLVLGNAFRFKKQGLPHLKQADEACEKVKLKRSNSTSFLHENMPAEKPALDTKNVSRLQEVEINDQLKHESLVVEDCDTCNPDSAMASAGLHKS